MSLEDAQTRGQGPRPTTGESSPGTTPPGGAAPAGERRAPAELDEFLARAVDRQIAEQRALRESLTQLSRVVAELHARPAPAPAVDLDDLEARVKRAIDATAQRFTSELRELRATVLPSIDRAVEASGGIRSVETDIGTLRDAVGGLSADVEGIAQALIDLNAGLRDWAEGVDRNVDAVREAAQQSRDALAESRDAVQQTRGALEETRHAMQETRGAAEVSRDAVLRSQGVVEESRDAMVRSQGALEESRDAVLESRNALEESRDAVLQVRDIATRVEERSAQAVEAVDDRYAESRPLLPVEGEFIDVDETGAIPVTEVTALAPRDFGSEIEQRVKETIELSLYLADQIESFDKAISNLGDLPTRLEGVISQALKRTLAARAKLDREAEMALDEVVATLDEHVENIGDLADTATTVRELAAGQARLASGLEAIAEAIDRSSEGRPSRAARSVAKVSTRKAAPKPGAGKQKPAAGKTAAPRESAKTVAKTSAKRTAKTGAKGKPAPARRKRASPDSSYLSLDADTD
jgi:methyl-accepting chemotaxis protein